MIESIRKDLTDLSDPVDLTPAGFLGLPATLRRFLGWIILERAVTCDRMAVFLDVPEAEALDLVRDLEARGLIEHVPACGFPVYRVCLEPRRLRPPEALRPVLDGDFVIRRGRPS